MLLVYASADELQSTAAPTPNAALLDLRRHGNYLFNRACIGGARLYIPFMSFVAESYRK